MLTTLFLIFPLYFGIGSILVALNRPFNEVNDKLGQRLPDSQVCFVVLSLILWPLLKFLVRLYQKKLMSLERVQDDIEHGPF
jgi:hypothetical protein